MIYPASPEAGKAGAEGSPDRAALQAFEPLVGRQDSMALAAAALAALMVGTASPPTLVDHPIVSSAAALYLDGADWHVAHLSNSSTGAAAAGTPLPAIVPGDILTDLQRAGKIPDPYWNTSWREPSFIAAWNQGSWQYSKSFATPAGPTGQEVLLAFDGVLMGATIELNGKPLTTTIDPLLGNVTGASDQFLRYVFPVGRLLLPPTTAAALNVLTVTFGAPQNERPGTSNGRFTFSTSIDWAPQMLTTDPSSHRSTFGFGLWKSVYLLPLPHGFAITQMVLSIFHTEFIILKTNHHF